MALDASRLAALHRARLVRLIEQSGTTLVGEPSSFPDGVAGRGADGRAHVLLLDPGPRAFGAAVLWARQAGADALVGFMDRDGAGDDGPGAQARRVQVLQGQHEVVAVGADGSIESVPPRPLPVVEPGPPIDRELEARCGEMALELWTDGSEVIVDLLGLETAIVVLDADGRLEVAAGVGAIDREANRVLHGTQPPWEVLERVAGEVRHHRRPGNETHPLATMARERWLDHTVRADASVVGATAAHRLAPVTPRRGLRTDEPTPALAAGPGGRTVVVSTTGADVSLVGHVADLIARERPDELVIALPEGTRELPMHRLEGGFTVPVRTVAIPAPWREPGA